MKSPLHILLLEDNPHDIALIESTLEAEGIAFSSTCVQTREDFVAALEKGGIDLILSDYALPTFDGLSAISIVCARWPEIPVILVSGTLGEERAIDAVKTGATDYVLKERLSRLAPAVLRAMEEVEDRAERHHLEKQLIEAQKMEVVGQLAAGVAHDFANIIGVIMGYSDLMDLVLTGDGPLREYVEEIRHASERAAALTRQLLIFSSKQAVCPVVLDINATLNDSEKILRRLIEENITMTMVPGNEIGHIQADTGYIGQVLMNLVVNARDAMPNGGNLTISTANVTLVENLIHLHHDAIAGDYVMISVSDTGMGMTEEVRAHLFEAFFTTKPIGKGTGLGLATCQTIVQQSGGFVAVQSELGLGTTFQIYFPRVEQPLDIEMKSMTNGALPHGTETLLVVEDEPSLRHLTRGILEAKGYEVLSASNGRDALHVAREHKGQPISLVLTDVVMPVMNGKVMADWLKTTYPDLKILFTSGYSENAISRQGVLEAGVEFLPKPYSSEALIRKVRELLDKTHASSDKEMKGVSGASTTSS